MNIQSFLIGYQAAKNAGGGASEDVRYVTFMSYDGLTEVGKLPVAAGYDCPNPKFAAPTKPSTAQYTYTHVGWATTPNGALDNNALKAVTADRVVYAAYAAVTRYYTVTYYDEDGTTVLHTQTVAYGATPPSYAPEKDGFQFDGWNPAVTTVTGDVSYKAVWSAMLTFANATWAQLAEISEAGEAANYFKVGDTKTLPLNFSGTTENVTVRIVGFNHDDLADGSGKAGISIVLASIMQNDAVKITEKTAYGEGYIWKTSQTRTILNSGAVYSALPVELRNVIKSVTKTSNAGLSENYGGLPKNSLYTTTDKVWLPSSTEVGFDADLNASEVAHGQGTRYEYYDSAAKRISGMTTHYPTRSMYTKYSNSSVCVFYSSGVWANYQLGKDSQARVFGFCI